MVTLYDYQEKLVHDTATAFAGGIKKLLAQAPTGSGKCLGKDTPILMFDGTIKSVQDVKTGELLMGPDSLPRKVLTTCSGSEMLYKVTPTKGDPYIVNESHILSLRVTNIGGDNLYCANAKKYHTGDIVNVGIKDYLASTKTFKHCAKGWRTGVNFQLGGKLVMDPYILGIWLGDGTAKGTSITTVDNEVIEAINGYAETIGCQIRPEITNGKCPQYHIIGLKNNGRNGGGNEFLNQLREINVLDNKHVPHEYKTASWADRMLLLAGLLDTDGYYNRSGFEIVTKFGALGQDILFLARSLGFAAYGKWCEKTCTNTGATGMYFRISISGDCDTIPTRVPHKKAAPRNQKKNHLVTGIKVEPIGIGDYYGFEIDGDHLFMLGDFTVTHNTVCFSAICNRWLQKQPSAILILVHRQELLKQTRRTLYDNYKIKAQPIIAGMKYIPPAQVYVGMIESTWKKVDRIPNKVGLVIIDEAHLANFFKVHEPLEALPEPPYILGFTATPYSANKKNPLKNYYEGIVTTVQIEELIKRDKLCQNITYAPKETVDRAELEMKGNDFDEGLMGIKFSAPKYVDNTVKAYQKFADGTKAIVFNCTVDHSQKVNNAFLLAGYKAKHLDGSMSKTERLNILKWFEATPGAILNNVGIATTGTDIPSIQTVIMNRSTKSQILWLQCTGRGARLHPSKAIFSIIDMGGNAVVLGDWNDSRDWENIFHNPPKAKDKQGVAPCKSCPQCDAILAATARTCKYCGYEYPAREAELEQELGGFVVVTKGLNIEELIEVNKERKEYYTFFDIGRQLAKSAKQTVPQMTQENAEFILSKYIEKGKEWCEQVGKRWNRWHEERAKETLWAELQERFKKWTPEGAPPEPTGWAPPQAPPEPTGWAPPQQQNQFAIRAIQPLSAIQ